VRRVKAIVSNFAAYGKPEEDWRGIEAGPVVPLRFSGEKFERK